MRAAAVVNQGTINQPVFNELIYGVPIRGHGAVNGKNRHLAFVHRIYQCFIKGVYMSTMLISGAGHNGE